MTIQLSTTVRNAKLDAMETTIGTAPVVRIFTGAQPANCAAANSGTELVNMTAPSDWMANASSGSKAKTATNWSGTGAAAGNAGHYRLYASDGTTCHLQGSVTATGGGGDLTLDNINIAVGQTVTITSYSWTENNA